MLNYIWLTLIALGILSALYFDSSEILENKYRNGAEITFELDSLASSANGGFSGVARVSAEELNYIYGLQSDESAEVEMTILGSQAKDFKIKVNERSPEIWREMAKQSGDESDISGTISAISRVNSGKYVLKAKFEKISFVRLKAVSDAVFEYAGLAVKIALGLVGIMALWLGIMKIAEKAGLIQILAKAVKPVTKFLFPNVPSDHPAIGAIIMNISANMLGLGNAATPFGIKAMEELDTLNEKKGTATNAMCTFLAINTAGLTFIPATAIAIRASAGSSNPAIIIGTSFFGATCATITGILSAKIFEKISSDSAKFSTIWSRNRKFFAIVGGIFLAAVLFFVTGLFKYIAGLFESVDASFFRQIIEWISILAIPLIIFAFVLFGMIKKVKIYEEFVEGAKEGFEVAVRIIPYLVAMLAAIGIFRAGGAMDLTISVISPVTDFIGFPAEALPMALMRPLSGSGSLGIMAEIMANYGPDSFIGVLVSTIMGSTETTLYVLAVYFGAVNIKKIRHAAAAGLLADAAGILGALWIVKMLFLG